MKQWILKTFYKRKIVKILFTTEDARLRTYYVIPNNDGTVVFGKAYGLLLNKDYMVLTGKNIPTYAGNYKSSKVFDLNDVEYKEGVYGANDFRTVIENDMADKVFTSSKKGVLENSTIIILAVFAIGILALGYYFTEQLNELRELISQIPIPETKDVLNG